MGPEAGPSGVAEGVGGSVSPLQSDLMGASFAEINKELLVKGNAAFRVGIYFRHPSSDVVVESIIPGAIQGVSYVYSTTVTAYLDHLGAANQGAGPGVTSLPDDSTQFYRTGVFRLEGI